MSLPPGARLGPYDILSLLGQGGMGEVYRARDTRLGRLVAVKVLSSQLVGSADSRDRFEREAHLIASLNHPHICTLYDVGREGDIEYLVMEYLEGETLSSRLARGPLPFDQTLEYGIQSADALDKAQRIGVIQGDLKPGNIMVTTSGATLLDFGLAKWQQPTADSEIGPSQRATQAGPITAQGTILGTVQYMAPEQVEGKEADARTDIFAFGAVVYEMATGKPAFAGTSQAGLIAKILESAPTPMRSLQPTTPASLERLVGACLAKDPDKRLQSAQDAKVGLEWIRDAAGESLPSGAVRGRAVALPWALFGLAVLVLAVFVWLRGADARHTAQAGPMQFEIPLPKEVTRLTAGFALSPNGRQLAFAAVGSDGTPRIWIRALDSLEMHPLAGTDSAGRLLIWSPDSRWIAFDSSGSLRTIDVGGGFPRTVCQLDRLVLSGSWNKDGVILFGGVGGPLMRVSADGGVPTAVTALDTARGDVAHLNPSFLPDGRHFVYLRELGTSEDISVGSLDAKPGEQDSRRLIRGGVFGPTFVPSRGGDDGQLLFVRGTALMAQRFDARHLTLSGDPARVVDQPVGRVVDSGLYSVVDDGTLVYRTPSRLESRLTWFDSSGHALAAVGPGGAWNHLVLSPDGTRAVVTKYGVASNLSLWSIDMSRGVPTPLANDPTTGYYGAAVSPDGRRMIFGVARPGQLQDLYERPIDAVGDGGRLLHSSKLKTASSWSPDGFLLFNVLGNGSELWTLPIKDPDKAVPLLQGGPNYVDARFSPDGHWVAYQSNESSRNEIYVRAFSGDRLERGGRVSPDGGYSPRWGSDGRHLYYLGPDYKLMATTLTLGADVQSTAPTALFQAPNTVDWWPSADGKRFLFLAPLQQRDSPFTVVVNWQQKLNR